MVVGIGQLRQDSHSKHSSSHWFFYMVRSHKFVVAWLIRCVTFYILIYILGASVLVLSQSCAQHTQQDESGWQIAIATQH